MTFPAAANRALGRRPSAPRPRALRLLTPLGWALAIGGSALCWAAIAVVYALVH